MDPKTHIQQPRPRDNFKAWEDPLFSDLRRIFSRAKLREVLTHSSFYEKEGRGNSRWVFAGMFVFKGQVAAVLHQYFSGDGTRLQHILGNLFRTERLQRMYNEWRLCQFVRAGDGFDIESHKHIFVYAILGYVSSQEENLRNWFIGKYILSDDVRHLLTHRKRNRDLMAQADEIVRQMDGRRLSLEMSRTEEGLHVASAVLSDGTVLCQASSKSWRYARTKAAKMALNLLAAPGRKALLSNPEYQAPGCWPGWRRKKPVARRPLQKGMPPRRRLGKNGRPKGRPSPRIGMPGGGPARRRPRSGRRKMPPAPLPKRPRKPGR